MNPAISRTFGRMALALLCAWIAATPVSGVDANPARRPARPSPEWLRNAVVYEIFTRNFSQEGTFAAVTESLPELKDLGVNVLWLMPVHPIGQRMKKGSIGSPYAVRDFMAVNPDYGTIGDLKRLVNAAHELDLRVIIDIVANHTSWDSVMMEHPEFYKKDDSGNIISPDPGWADVAGLDYGNEELQQYMIEMLKFWVRDVGVDGFRCDVAYMVPTAFWERARGELELINPEIIMLAEASKPELLLKAFDMDYSWPLHATLNEVLLDGAPASNLQKSWEDSRKRFPSGSLHLRISDNHDEARAVSRFGIHGALAAQVLMLTLDGVPLFYNGMEVGDATESGAPALFEKLPIYWEPKERPPLREIYGDLIRLRERHPAFTNDRVVWLKNSQPADLVTFMRQDPREEFVVLINFSSRPVPGSVEVPHASEYEPVRISGVPSSMKDGLSTFELNGFEWRIYRRQISH